MEKSRRICRKYEYYEMIMYPMKIIRRLIGYKESKYAHGSCSLRTSYKKDKKAIIDRAMITVFKEK